MHQNELYDNNGNQNSNYQNNMQQNSGYSPEPYPTELPKKKMTTGTRVLLISLIAAIIIAAGLGAYVVASNQKDKKRDDVITKQGTVTAEQTNGEAQQTPGAPEAVLTTEPEGTMATPAPEPTPRATAEEPKVNTMSNNLLDSMSKSDKRALNTFLSNFSETNFGDYNKYAPQDDKVLFYFAFAHERANNYEKTHPVHGYMGISGQRVNVILDKYFGRTITLPSGNVQYDGSWKYEDGYFLCPEADGDTYFDFSVATEMKDNGNGTYTVSFASFWAGFEHEGNMKALYDYTPSQAFREFGNGKSGEAVVRKKTYNGKQTYELVSYFCD